MIRYYSPYKSDRLPITLTRPYTKRYTVHNAIGESRTHDRRIKNPMLCQLSYDGCYFKVTAHNAQSPIRTGITQLRRLVLYPVKLPGQILISICCIYQPVGPLTLHTISPVIFNSFFRDFWIFTRRRCGRRCRSRLRERQQGSVCRGIRSAHTP